MSKHTPWPEAVDAFRLGFSECEGTVGMTYDGNPESPRSVAYDAGRALGQNVPEPWCDLLAAAPDLLAALRDVLPFVCAGAAEVEVARARAAIAKAEGGAR